MPAVGAVHRIISRHRFEKNWLIQQAMDLRSSHVHSRRARPPIKQIDRSKRAAHAALIRINAQPMETGYSKQVIRADFNIYRKDGVSCAHKDIALLPLRS